jgi:hypothetical protein
MIAQPIDTAVDDFERGTGERLPASLEKENPHPSWFNSAVGQGRIANNRPAREPVQNRTGLAADIAEVKHPAAAISSGKRAALKRCHCTHS